jgi:short-subunit dehydrogenase
MSAIETRGTALIPGASGAAHLNNKADLARIETALRTDASITLLVNNAGVGATAPLLNSECREDG